MIPSSDKSLVVYLAGPMTHQPYFNFPRFNAVATALRAMGHTVFNPAEADMKRHGGVNISANNPTGDPKLVKATHKFSLREALGEDMNYICYEANALVLLPHWERSHGCMAEHRLAVALQTEGMQIFYLTEHECSLLECYREAAE